MNDSRDRQSVQIHRWLAVFHPGDDVVELRALNVSGRKAVSKCFDDLEALAKQAVEWDAAGARGVYFTLNPLRKAMVGAEVAARKADVMARHWLPIDCDPVREAGLNSTDEEKQSAWSILDRCKGILDAAGFTGAVVADSGNGWHLCYPIQLPNNDDSQALVKAILVGLHKRCSDDKAKVDVSTHDAPRIWKLPGVLVRKGPHSEERPQRWSRLIALEEFPQHRWDKDRASSNVVQVKRLLRSWLEADDLKKNRPPSEMQIYAEAALNAELEILKNTQPGDRNNQLNRAAFALGTLVGAGALDRIEIESALRRCGLGLGLTASEVQSTLRSGLDAGVREPRDLSFLTEGTAIPTAETPAVPEVMLNGSPQHTRLPATPKSPTQPPSQPWEQPLPLPESPQAMSVPEFPLNVFPQEVREYVEEIAWATNCPIDFAAIPCLVVAAGAIGNSCRLGITRSHHQSSALFAAIVGRPGSGKSTPIDFAIQPVLQREHRFYEEFQSAKGAWDSEDKDTRGDRPKLKRCFVDDTTTEALAKTLSDNPRGLLMVRDELAALVLEQNQYRQGKGADRQIYLKLWSSQVIKVDRTKNDGIPLTVRRPFLSILGGIQPAVLEYLRGDSQVFDDGFFDRFLLSYPAEKPAVGEQWREVTEFSSTNWKTIVDHLYSLEMVASEDLSEADYPRKIPLSMEARRAWAAQTESHAVRMNEADFPDDRKGFWSKLVPGYAGRFALILQLLWWASKQAEDREVEAQAVASAFQLVEYFDKHAEKIRESKRSVRRVHTQQRLLDWIEAREQLRFSKRDCFRTLHRTFDESLTNLTNELHILVELGYVREVRQPGSKFNPQGFVEVFEVNPLWKRGDSGDRPQNNENPR